MLKNYLVKNLNLPTVLRFDLYCQGFMVIRRLIVGVVVFVVGFMIIVVVVIVVIVIVFVPLLGPFLVIIISSNLVFLHLLPFQTMLVLFLLVFVLGLPIVV
jgi:hypothetical protein